MEFAPSTAGAAPWSRPCSAAGKERRPCRAWGRSRRARAADAVDARIVAEAVRGGCWWRIAPPPVDFRKGHDGLRAAAARSMPSVARPSSSARSGRSASSWSGSGLVLVHKWREGGTFARPQARDGVMRVIRFLGGVVGSVLRTVVRSSPSRTTVAARHGPCASPPGSVRPRHERRAGSLSSIRGRTPIRSRQGTPCARDVISRGISHSPHHASGLAGLARVSDLTWLLVPDAENAGAGRRGSPCTRPRRHDLARHR